MCSFLVIISRESISNYLLNSANNYIQSRGPDKTNFIENKVEDIYFYGFHNLLDISGKGISQPLKSNDLHYMFFNGEIYDPSDGISDTELLNKELKKRNLVNFLKNASGEFAITTLDLKKRRLDLFSDLIKTKPLSYALNPNILGISTYGGALEKVNLNNIKDLEPNTHLNINFKELGNYQIKKQKLYKLNLSQRNKSLSKWNNQINKSIKQRIYHYKSAPFVPLSSGYDSGLICCALNHLGIKYTTVTLGDYEDKTILKKRIKINKQKSCLKHFSLPPISEEEYSEYSRMIQNKFGNIKYSHLDGDRLDPIFLHEDGGAIGLAKICEFMKSYGFNCLLSGSGADEIISDYGFNGIKLYSHSEFGGLFPSNLEDIFPWKKFYGDTQRSYLLKDEMISGIYGIEGRYPFLDKNVIQEFLSLSAHLKNKRYKNCIASFLDNNSYPFSEGDKLGFLPLKTKYNIMERIINKVFKLLN